MSWNKEYPSEWGDMRVAFEDERRRQTAIRLAYAKEQLARKQYTPHFENETELRIMYRGNEIRFFPYTGWHTGKGIQDGRGIHKLLKQLVALLLLLNTAAAQYVTGDAYAGVNIGAGSMGGLSVGYESRQQTTIAAHFVTNGPKQSPVGFLGLTAGYQIRTQDRPLLKLEGGAATYANQKQEIKLLPLLVGTVQCWSWLGLRVQYTNRTSVAICFTGKIE